VPAWPGPSPDARAIADELTARQISLSLGGSVYDPTDAVGRLLFNVLAMVAEFESDLIRLRTREGMKVAEAKGRLRGKQPKLNRRQEAHLVSLVHTAASTAPSRSPNSSAWAAPPSTAPSNDNASQRKQASPRRRRGADASPRHRLSRIRLRSGTAGASALRGSERPLVVRLMGRPADERGTLGVVSKVGRTSRRITPASAPAHCSAGHVSDKAPHSNEKAQGEMASIPALGRDRARPSARPVWVGAHPGVVSGPPQCFPLSLRTMRPSRRR
jgi:hypothetical protein